MEKVTRTTGLGEITGVVLPRGIEFRGVQYAEAGRWQLPKPVTHWDGVYDAFSGFGNKCPQYHWSEDEFYGKEFYVDPEFDVPESEDCLYMTITVPKEDVPKPETGYPVAIWYHGGGMVNGWGTEQEFDGEAFAARGVILCRVNERLGLFGGFCHPALVARDGLSGNYQLADHIAALDFVYDNIRGFGGDPDKITIFGQSAGSMGVEAMLCSPRTGNRIRGAIMQSGISYVFTNRLLPTMEQAALCGEQYLEEKGMTFKEFEALPWQDLYALTDEYRAFAEQRGVSYAPVLDGYYLTKNYNDSVKDGDVRAPFLMAGCCADDMRMNKENPEESPLYKAVSGWCSELNGQPGKTAYAYFFERKMPGDDAGAFHSAELWYVFGTYARCWRPLSEQDAALSEKMSDAWTDFAKNGNPGWAPCTLETPYFKHWNIE
ncbi:MAG: carboxylesterase family protein [Lachnospiraceae bacterium]|nr:carboxylesterase family protein [Lachnospiraceae bacterium]